MTDKHKQLAKLTELHTKVVERLGNIDDKLLEDPLQDDLVDLRIRLRQLAAGISLDISLLETDIASAEALRSLGRYQYGGLHDGEESITLEDKFKPWEKKE